VKGVLIHQRLAELDTQGIWKYPLPEMAASEDEIAATELKLGYRLDQGYRQFLRHANGWKSFYQDMDIRGLGSCFSYFSASNNSATSLCDVQAMMSDMGGRMHLALVVTSLTVAGPGIMLRKDVLTRCWAGR
jgi:hypothetical protein